jgi:type II secretory pathway component PulF
MSEERYEVRATDAAGRDASAREVPAGAGGSVARLVAEFRARGLQVSALARTAGARRLFEPRAVSGEEFALFNAELGAACRRGVPLPGALRALSRGLGRRKFQGAIEECARSLEAGQDLATALRRRPEVFPPGYVALVEAGLQSGNLAGTLLLFSGEARLGARVRHQLLAGLVYPLAILFLASGALSFFAAYLLPEVQGFVSELHMMGERALSFALVQALRPVLLAAPALLLLLLGGLALAGKLLMSTAHGARRLGALQLGLPFFGRFFRAVALARLSRTLANALAARVPVPEALGLAGLATANAALQEAAEAAAALVREGQPLSAALAKQRRLPATLAWMLGLAEQRGEVVPTLEEYARLEEERAGRLGDLLPKVTVTLATLAAALMIFACLCTVLTPLLELLRMMTMLGA